LKYILNTNRLALRQLTPDDADFIIGLVNSPGWLQFIGDKNVRTKEQAIGYLETGPFKSYQQHGFGLYLVERKEDGATMGVCGLLKREYLEAPDIGYAFLSDFHGKGYALEAVNATLNYAKTVLNINKVCAITLPENVHSIKVLEKAGFSFATIFTAPGAGQALHLYSR
jgi:RimJ/RimL family protein N-acetyltransferase